MLNIKSSNPSLSPPFLFFDGRPGGDVEVDDLDNDDVDVDILEDSDDVVPEVNDDVCVITLAKCL